jgi:hypothetical protein
MRFWCSRGLMSIEFEDESQSLVECCEFVIGHPANEFAEPFRGGLRSVFVSV